MCAKFSSPSKESIVKEFGALRDNKRAAEEGPSTVFPMFQARILLPDLLIKNATWGIFPLDYKDPTGFVRKYFTNNSKSENVSSSKLYSPLWTEGNRCVIPVEYFVEWTGRKGSKTELGIKDPNQKFTPIAGLYKKNREDYLFTMLTCEPNPFMKDLHHRMPVILEDWIAWLDPDLKPEEALKQCKPYGGELIAKAV